MAWLPRCPGGFAFRSACFETRFPRVSEQNFFKGVDEVEIVRDSMEGDCLEVGSLGDEDGSLELLSKDR